jgi:hypothetical protein
MIFAANNKEKSSLTYISRPYLLNRTLEQTEDRGKNRPENVMHNVRYLQSMINKALKSKTNTVKENEEFFQKKDQILNENVSEIERKTKDLPISVQNSSSKHGKLTAAFIASILAGAYVTNEVSDIPSVSTKSSEIHYIDEIEFV